MANSKISMINAALALNGEKPIISLTDNRKAARIANSIYDTIEDQIFAMNINYKFCKTRAELSQLDTDPIFGEYDHQYALPDNFIRLLATVNEDGDNYEYKWDREVFIEGTNQTDVILTNEDEVFLKYIVRRTDPAKFPGWFSQLIIVKLAIYLAEPLKQDTQIQRKLDVMWTDAKDDAEAGNASEDVRVDENHIREELGNDDVKNAAVYGIPARRRSVYEQDI